MSGMNNPHPDPHPHPDPPPRPGTAAFAAAEAQKLSVALWQDREVLTELVRILESRDGDTEDVGTLLDRLRQQGLARAIAVSSVSRCWNLEETELLHRLTAQEVPEPWLYILSAHQEALAALVHRVSVLSDREESLAGSPLRIPLSLLESLGLEPF